jgi:hypothetical protein
MCHSRCREILESFDLEMRVKKLVRTAVAC